MKHETKAKLKAQLLAEAMEKSANCLASGELRIDAIGISLERPEFDRFFRLVETGALN